MLRLVLLLCGIATLVLLGGAGPAAAHDVLVGSDPADGAALDRAPASITFTFDQPVQNFQPVIAVTGPDGRSQTTTGVQVLGNVVSAPVTLGAAGAYVAAYRIVSADGHPVSGQIRFTVATAGSAPAVSVAAGPAAGPVPPAGRSGGLSAGLWIGLAVAVLLLAAAAVALIRRPPRGT